MQLWTERFGEDISNVVFAGNPQDFYNFVLNESSNLGNLGIDSSTLPRVTVIVGDKNCGGIIAMDLDGG